MENIFQQGTTTKLLNRIEALTPNRQANWGKMNVSQMLAHCNVTYEMAYENIHPKPNAFLKFILKIMAKNAVVSDKPYPKNGRTAPQFIITGAKSFDKEKQRLIDYIERTKNLGEQHFEGKESHSFGPLSSNQWHNMFYKHLDHHLTQFGV